MAHLIDKSALVAEIEKRVNFNEKLKAYSRKDECDAILSFINTLEVKEVDLEIEQRMKECPYRQVGCNRYEDTPVECDGRCSWVADYPKLKELKAQKGE